MFYSGFTDEAAAAIDGQIAVLQQLGWGYLEPRNIDGVNLHDLDEAAFENVVRKLADANLRVNCLGSAVANWQCDPFREEDFRKTCAQLDRALKRMATLNCRMLRGMSFLVQLDRAPFDPEVEKQVFAKVRELVRRCEDAGVVYAHENCRNYGGQSAAHTLRLLEAIDSPNFKLIFDTGNPLWSRDRSGGAPYPWQSSWNFYRQVRDEIVYVHIKDAIRIPTADGEFAGLMTFPGEGEGEVRRIVADLLARGYDGGFSMEPHLIYSFSSDDPAYRERARRAGFIEYGRRFEQLIESIRQRKKR